MEEAKGCEVVNNSGELPRYTTERQRTTFQAKAGSTISRFGRRFTIVAVARLASVSAVASSTCVARCHLSADIVTVFVGIGVSDGNGIRAI